MSRWMSKFYPEVRFGGFTRVDGSVAFFQRIRSLLEPHSIVLDIGCGRGKIKSEDPVRLRRDLYDLRGACAKVIGIDPDLDASVNPLIHEFHQLHDFKNWPIETQAIDLAFADFVIEHVEDVDPFFSECHRVLKPGGYLCLRTPNVRSYFGLISRLIPNRYHARAAARIQEIREHEDVFPTVYRCNTRGRLKRALNRHGFDGCVIGHEPEPAYFSFSAAAYALGVLHQRLAPDAIKINLFAFAKKF